MPFSHDGVFHLFYLLDENHHQGNGGLGGHQWAHASSRDLLHWQHHPLALAIDTPEEASICTGSVFWHAGTYYAFYAVRRPGWTQHLCRAVSVDGIHFKKDPANPFLSPPPGYSPVDLRDPVVFEDGDGGFVLLATSKLDPYLLEDGGGCLLMLRSRDLQNWQVEGPLLIPASGAEVGSVPECPDYFTWNGWHYLLYSQGLQTYYRLARSWTGPWHKPPLDLLDCPLAGVMKTARWGSWRIGAAFLGTRQGDLAGGAIQWAGNIFLRELVQHDDGSLGTRFLPELTPSGSPLPLTADWLTPGASGNERSVRLDAGAALEAAALDGLPLDFSFRCRVIPNQEGGLRFGIGLRGPGKMISRCCRLYFEPSLGRVSLADQQIYRVSQINQPFTLQVNCQGDIIEACVGDSRCIINRLPGYPGKRLFLFCQDGQVIFEDIEVFEKEKVG